MPGVCAAEKVSNLDCLSCHEDPSTTKEVDGKTVALVVDGAKLLKSVHKSLSCTDCHQAAGEIPHPDKMGPAQCASCHEAEAKAYATSIHGVSSVTEGSKAATCGSCHGSHEISPVKQADSPVFKLNLPQTCAKCHSNAGISDEYRMKNPQAAAQYMESIHGRALLKMGLIVAPSCNDCHGVHNIVREVDKASPIHHQNIARTCGKCHVGVQEIYDQSVHGKLLAKGDKRAPACTDCHTAHEIDTPTNGHLKALSDQRCGKCHQERLEHYRDTYHGKAMALGVPNKAPMVAACYDCHGHHDVLPPSDPRSTLSTANIVGTCSKCHSGSNPQFVKYQPHADPLDAKNYRWLHYTFIFMTSLLLGVFAFFGVHTAFWLFRSIWLYHHDSKTFREAKVRTQKDDVWYTRFNPFERFLHLLVVTSFLLLVITGMPLKFYYTDWARMLFKLIGGPDVARALHHFGAIITFLYFGLHVSDRLRTIWERRGEWLKPETGKWDWVRIRAKVFGPDSMLPTVQDWRDFVAHQKWFFGRGPRPQFDRWTYWEKFDYFAVFWGVFAIGLSGLIMWFPQWFTIWLPGWVINIALIVHSDEALLAAGFIFTFHFFNTHFRLEKWPMDTVIFSGRVSKTEMLHERKRWFDRLQKEGKLDDAKVKDDWEGWKRIARSFGYLFFGLGLLLLFLIIYAMISRLLRS